MTKDEFIKKRKALRHFREIERHARPWQSRPQARDPAYADLYVDPLRSGDPQYKPPQPKPYWNPETPKTRDHRYFAPI